MGNLPYGEDDGFYIFQKAKANWMLKNQDKAFRSDYSESGDRAGYQAVIASLNKGTDGAIISEGEKK